ncbi:MAG TPA: protein kinase [Solirubrobacteraceae bacterium]|nr:protein kinase [Solirubrobacteraceae bacterium]
MPHAPDLVGCALDDRYELHELIGEGTFGRVYRGYDRRLAREVAIKVIKPWWAEDPEWAGSFGREAQLLARISDPGIVQIYDVGHAEEGLYYVTELVDGESLARRLRRGGPLPVPEACGIAERLCRALEHAHAEHIVHRDIKPANVLLSRRGEVKVGDLGIARLADGGTTDGGTATIVGTPRYMAPEQASGQPVTPATDVYSAGIVLYEMLAGEPPFGGDSAVEIALRHVQEPVPPLPAGTPESVQQVVERALAKEPGDRYQTAAAMAEELVRARAGGSSGRARERPAAGDPTWVAPRFSPRRNVNPSARRRRIAALTVALGLLCAMVVAAIVLTAGPTVRVPALRGLSRGAVNTKLRHLHLRADFAARFSNARPGTVVAQTPAVGTRVKQDSAIQLAVSKGPRPVEVPALKGSSSTAAVARLHHGALNAKLTYVAAPGTAPGIVTGQSPAAGGHRPVHSTVTLFVAETPSWRYVTSFAGERSVAFKIRGSQWRVVYRMSYDGTCDFVLFCNGPSARVIGVGASSIDQSFDLGDGDSQSQVFKAGPGQYQIAIKPGWDAARWSITVEDWF